MILLSQETGFLKPIAWLLGQIFNLLYNFVDAIDGLFKGAHLPIIGICVILFTIIVKLLMMPLTVKQQKFSKLSSMMNPELQAIQKKYKDKRDAVSVTKMQEETKAVYAKYGTSPSGGCLVMLIQLPIMFGLYRVIYKIPGYVTKIRVMLGDLYSDLSWKIYDWKNKVPEGIKLDTGSKTKFIDSAYNLSKSDWKEFADAIGQNTTVGESIRNSASALVAETGEKLTHINNFFGISLTQAPGFRWSWALIIPILAGVTQWLTSKLMTTQNKVNTDDSQQQGIGNTMKVMNLIMPIMTVFFCITFPSCVGIYWIASSVVQIIVQIVINKKMDKIDIEQMVQENIDKVNAKRAKQGLPPQKMVNGASTYADLLKKQEAREARKEDRDAQIKKSTDYYSKTSNPNSLAAKAAMVKMYNEKNNNDNKNKKNKKNDDN